MRPLRMALLGLGSWGSRLLKEYLSDGLKKVVQLTHALDISQERVEWAKDLVGKEAEVRCSDASSLGQLGVEAIHIATPNETHHPLALRALRAGLHVLLEKPMALSFEQAFQLAKEAKERGLTLQVAHIFRFNNSLKRAKELMEKGTIGRVLYLDIEWSAYLSPLPKKDIIFDLAPHPIDAIHYLTGEWPREAFSYVASHNPEGIEDQAYILLRLGGVLSSLKLSWVQPGPKVRSITITGSQGSLKVDALRQRLTLSGQRDERIRVKPNNTIASMISHFARSAKGLEESKNGPLLGAMNVKVLEAIKEGLNSNRPITLTSVVEGKLGPD